MLFILRLFVTATVVAVSATLGTAFEMYDDPGDMELMYQDINYLDNSPLGPEPRFEDPMRSVILYKMLNSFRNRDVSPSVLTGPKWVPSDTVLVPPDTFDLSQLKEPLMKRVTNVKLHPKENSKIAVRPQQKWKIKKGRPGAQMICYFKLCAFRSPY